MPEEEQEVSQEELYNKFKKMSLEREISDDATEELISMTMIQPSIKSSQAIEIQEGNAVLKQLDFMEQFTPDLTTTKLGESEKPMITGKLAICDILQFISETEEWNLKSQQDMRPSHRFFVRRIAGEANTFKSAGGFMAQLMRSKYAFSEGKQELLQKQLGEEKKKGWSFFGGGKK